MPWSPQVFACFEPFHLSRCLLGAWTLIARELTVLDFPGFCGHVKLSASRTQGIANADKTEQLERSAECTSLSRQIGITTTPR